MIQKQVSPKGKSVKVTFELPAEVAEESVVIVGDFNDWNPDRHPMKLAKKKGVWTKSISFKPGEKHEFRYYVDGERWLNDDQADSYSSNEFFSQNSVVTV